MPTTTAARAIAHLEESWNRYLEDLKTLVRIASVSTNPPPDAALRASAEATAEVLRRAGFEHIEVIEVPGGHPYVLGDWLHAQGAPTVLLYGHHDVQPPGRPEKWISPPFEPTVRDGRLYGRGAVDDKAGIMMHVAACASWLAEGGTLPINVKLVIEGEEETGSESLGTFLEKYRSRLGADVLVLTDTANLDEGVPALTVALRGIAGVSVEVQALDHPVHSGMWGGPVPDPVIALCKAIAALTDEQGCLRNEFWTDVRPLTAEERAELQRMPCDLERVRAQIGLEKGAQWVGRPDTPFWARIWREPAVTVIALEARPIAGSSNQIIESARARISVRLVPDMNPRRIQDLLVEHFRKHVPWNLRVQVEREHAATWWFTEPKGPAFDAARRALERGFGRRPFAIGCGGSIPFVEPFVRVLGGAPALLMGVEDPICNAHGENESLRLADWKSGTRAAVYLYEELAALRRE